MKKKIDVILKEFWDDVVMNKKMPYHLQVKSVTYVRRIQELLKTKKDSLTNKQK